MLSSIWTNFAGPKKNFMDLDVLFFFVFFSNNFIVSQYTFSIIHMYTKRLHQHIHKQFSESIQCYGSKWSWKSCWIYGLLVWYTKYRLSQMFIIHIRLSENLLDIRTCQMGFLQDQPHFLCFRAFGPWSSTYFEDCVSGVRTASVSRIVKLSVK